MLDESETINDHQWKAVKTFSKNLVEAVGISATENRAGVATFSDYGRVRISCNDHSTTESLVGAINNLTRKGLNFILA